MDFCVIFFETSSYNEQNKAETTNKDKNLKNLFELPHNLQSYNNVCTTRAIVSFSFNTIYVCVLYFYDISALV